MGTVTSGNEAKRTNIRFATFCMNATAKRDVRRSVGKEGLSMRGTWTFYVAEGAPLDMEELRKARRNEQIGRAYRKLVFHNIIPLVARTSILQTLAGIPVSLSETKITHQQLGTSTTTPGDSDTGLITPNAGTRKAISSMAVSADDLNIVCFWAAGEATGTWRELCTFINGTGTSNSGTCFNRAAINVPITASQSLTLDGVVSLSAA